MTIQNPFQNAGVALVVGFIINANTGGDKTKQAARAADGLTLIGALQQLNNGDVANGVAALEAALSNLKNLTPGEAIALQSLVQFGTQQLSLLVTIGGSTILGQVDSAIATSVLNEAATVCAAYVNQK